MLLAADPDRIYEIGLWWEALAVLEYSRLEAWLPIFIFLFVGSVDVLNGGNADCLLDSPVLNQYRILERNGMV